MNAKKCRPLLTIAIPTYNRAKILDICLQKVLEQIFEFTEQIELVVSDNSSSDNTTDIVEKYINKFDSFIFNKQPFNTGYFGNFRKCRELSNGKYLWLLSDNDHIFPGVIRKIIEHIMKAKDIGALYLHNVIRTNNGIFEIKRTQMKQIRVCHRYFRMMLISSVIFLNEKSDDEYIHKQFTGNTLLGFLYFCSAMRIRENIDIIIGKIYQGCPTGVYFDVFDSWTNDIMACVAYMEKCNLFDHKLKEYFVSGFLNRILFHHVSDYCKKAKLHGYNTEKIIHIRDKLDRYYISYSYYRKFIRPLFNQNEIISEYLKFRRRVENIAYKVCTLRKIC